MSAVSKTGLPDGPSRPRMVQTWFWLRRPIWFLDHCWQTYGDVFTMRLPFGMAARVTATRADPPGGGDVRPARRRAVRADRPARR